MLKGREKKLLSRMYQTTTRWGIYQHSIYNKADPSFGYALDDQARAYLVATYFREKNLAKIYLNFIKRAIGKQKGNWQFFYDKKGGIVPDKKIECSEDALGMVAWVLMETKKESEICDYILNKSLTWEPHLRARAYLILGICNAKENKIEKEMVKMLHESFNIDNEWHWFENKLTYANALLPWALWRHGRVRHNNESLRIAKLATDFLIDTCRDGQTPMPIGCKGWYFKGGIKNKYDQQSVEVGYMVCCLKEAYLATNNIYYLQEAGRWWSWYWGNNTQGVVMIDKKGGCFDAVSERDKVNLNQGAESTISFLMAYCAFLCI